jgi:hypothetical protein
MTPSKTKIELSGAFIWPNPDIAALKALVDGPIRAFWEKDPIRVDCNTEKMGVSRRVMYGSLEEWISNTDTANEINELTIRCGSYGGPHELTIQWQKRDGSFYFSGRTPADEEKDNRLQNLEALVIHQLDLRQPDAFSGERLYSPATKDDGWKDALLDLAKSSIGSSENFSGWWDKLDSGKRRTKNEADWKQQASSARDWACHWSKSGHNVDIEFKGAQALLRINVGSWKTELVDHFLDQVAFIPGLQPRTIDKENFGEHRRYFISVEATEEWYSRALGLVQEFAGPCTRFWGRVSRGGTKPSRRGYGKMAVWSSALKAAMDQHDIERSYVEYNGPQRRVTLDLDHIRDLFQIDIQSPKEQEIDLMHSSLAKELDLTLAPDDAYQYRNSGRIYEIKWADAEAFASRLEIGFKALFRGRRVALKTGTLHIGTEHEQVRKFRDLGLMLTELKNAKELSELHILAEGPRGEFMGVHADKNLRRLRLLAFVDIQRFKMFANELDNGLLKMKLRETYDDTAAGPIVDEKKGVWIIPIIAAFAGLVGALFGTELFKAIRESSELAIDLPVSKDGVAMLEPGDVTVGWTYKYPRTFGRPVSDRNHEAMVQVIHEGDAKVVINDQHYFGSVRIPNLEVGRYEIRVATNDSSKVLEVVVATKMNTPTQNQQLNSHPISPNISEKPSPP